ncbi:MAG: hypothetical protein NUK63_04615 [Candidatus Bathyarchaeum tardum]|nr:MAG: hypothetical protein NUK63_04615 [Candidatus Bathyarchaeum tardum]
MKKQIVFLMLTALMMGTIVPSVFADVAFTSKVDMTGHYGIVAAGVGLEDLTTGDIQINVPGTVEVAYLYWAGIDGAGLGDDEVTFDAVDVVADVTLEEPWGNWAEYTFVYVKDVTGLVSSGDNTYTISGVELWRNYGAGLVVIYEDESLPVSRVIWMDGSDGFWFGWDPDLGPNSDVVCFPFDACTNIRDVEMVLFSAGTEHDDRPNDVWTITGTGVPVETVVDAVGAQSSGLTYPLYASDGRAWDTYTDSISIPENHEYLCVQIESIPVYGANEDQDWAGRGTSGLFLGAGIVLPVCEQELDGLSPGFWKHNIAVYLGENPGRYSVPHEGEPRITDEILEAYFDMIPVTAEDAYAALTAKGKGSGQIRLDMANLFNAAAGYAPYSD